MPNYDYNLGRPQAGSQIPRIVPYQGMPGAMPQMPRAGSAFQNNSTLRPPPKKAGGAMPGAGQVTSAFGDTQLPFGSASQNQHFLNRQIDSVFEQNDPYVLRKRFAPAAASGVLQSGATESLISPALGDAAAQVEWLRGSVPYQRGLQNANAQLNWDTSRSADALGQAGMLGDLSDMNWNFNLGQGQNFMQFLMQLFGGF